MQKANINVWHHHQSLWDIVQSNTNIRYTKTTVKKHSWYRLPPLTDLQPKTSYVFFKITSTNLSENRSLACLDSWCGRSRLCMTRAGPAASVASDMEDTSDGRAALVCSSGGGFCRGLLGLCGEAESHDEPPVDCCFSWTGKHCGLYLDFYWCV